MRLTRRVWLRLLTALGLGPSSVAIAAKEDPLDPQPFGAEFPQLDSLATGTWWEKPAPRGPQAPPPLDVPRDQVVAFAIYIHDQGILKLTAQLYPLRPGEPRTVRLELERQGAWTEIARQPIVYPGWTAHFRVEPWDSTSAVRYRVRHGESAEFVGTIRRDPTDKDVIVVASMSCNSSRTTGPRPEIVDRLRQQDPDMLFFAGDQTYRHTEHTAGWIEFGLQFRELLRDRPTITIPDDHDVGHPNLWGENGKRSLRKDNADGGYYYPPSYVNMVQRQQTWHLPDPVDPAPVQQGIGVYFTRLRLGGVDFAILEDRKFKSGPAGKIPQQGPRPDHVTVTSYDPQSIDVPGLELLGARQLAFLNSWSADWTGAVMKAVLSQTAFCGAVHLHGQPNNRLLADLDSNGWPQTGRCDALRAIRRAGAVHLCGDQHLAVVVQHGIEQWRDGPFGFTSPALVNTIYGRWWHPLDQQPGAHPIDNSPLPWTGDYRDGLGNRITMLAYANPQNIQDERQRADGYGLVHFDKLNRRCTFACWPRFATAAGLEAAQFPGWPITIDMANNDGRQPVAWLPDLTIASAENPVIQVQREADGEVLYTVRCRGKSFQPPVYAPGTYTVRIGRDRPDGHTITGVTAGEKTSVGSLHVTWGGTG